MSLANLGAVAAVKSASSSSLSPIDGPWHDAMLHALYSAGVAVTFDAACSARYVTGPRFRSASIV